MPIAGDSVAGVHLEQAPKPGSDPESLRQALASILERIDCWMSADSRTPPCRSTKRKSRRTIRSSSACTTASPQPTLSVNRSRQADLVLNIGGVIFQDLNTVNFEGVPQPGTPAHRHDHHRGGPSPSRLFSHRSASRLIANRAAHAEIGARRVQYHLKKVFTKLGIGSRSQLDRVLPV
jgi:hypothetical protein